MNTMPKSAVGRDTPASERASGQIISHLKSNDNRLSTIASRVIEMRARILGQVPESPAKNVGEVFHSCVDGDMRNIVSSQSDHISAIEHALEEIESWV